MATLSLSAVLKDIFQEEGWFFFAEEPAEEASEENDEEDETE